MIPRRDGPRTFALIAASLALVVAGGLGGVAAAYQTDPPPDPNVVVDPQLPNNPPPNVAPALGCTARTLRVMAPGVSGVQLLCDVGGAPATDQSFVVQETGAPADRVVCSGPLDGGAGSCSSALIDRAEAALSGLVVTASSLPSGTPLGSVSTGTPTRSGLSFNSARQQ